MAIGVFGLQVAYKLKRTEVMSLDDTHGWFGGGGTPSFVSTVDRIDFSNDSSTASPRGPLSSARGYLAATGNSNYGWFGGGGTAVAPLVASATVNRIDFSNDSSTASARGPLSSARGYLAATGNSNYGWFGGGSPTTSRVERIDFSNDSSTASPRGPLSLARSQLAATGNSNYGWFGGGTPSATAVDRIDFSNDSSTASVRGSLTNATKFRLAATGNSNYGWFGGGFVSAPVSTVDRIDFSNDLSTTSVRGSLSLSRSFSGASSNSNYGWFGGGSPGPLSTVDRIDFSNDSVSASPRGPLSSARNGLASTSGQAKGPAIKLQKAGNYGWFGGGLTSIQVATVDRIDFSNDSATALVRGPLSLARYGFAATGNSNYGWFGAGFIPAPLGGPATATVDRIDFSNDSSTASPRGPLSLGRFYLAATGNSNYGWFGGGITPTQVSTVDRIDFSNDSATASPRSPLNAPAGRNSLAATGNSNYGWFGGGATPTTTVATVDRIDFSNDSATASVKGLLSLARYALVATGNSNYGWFGGGYNSTGVIPSSHRSTVDRIDFSNDSLTALVRGTLSSPRSQLAATGNSNYGWFGGGYNPSLPVRKSTVDRIDFSNDSTTASPRGRLSPSPGVLYPTATSNTPT